MNELALKAGRKRQSSETGFVHLGDRIPIVENFCFALALMQSKTVENFLEGKELVERLLHFQGESGNFPTYLHQYPQCEDYFLAADLLAPFHWMEALYPAIKPAFNRLRAYLERQETTPDPVRLAAMTGEIHAPLSPKLLSSLYLGEQRLRRPLTPGPWQASSFAGPAAYERQSGFEPEVTLYDLFMGQWSGAFSKRALQDHDCHLLASLIRPIDQPFAPIGESTTFSLDPAPEHLRRWQAPFKRIWGSPERTHSLVLQGGNIRSISEDLVVEYGEPIEEDHRQKQRELCLYLDRQPLKIWVEGEPATTFKIGETLKLETEEKTITLKFNLLEGEGDFLGHVTLGNRPSQLIEDKFEAYDWQIFLRTIRRSEKCCVGLSLDFS